MESRFLGEVSLRFDGKGAQLNSQKLQNLGLLDSKRLALFGSKEGSPKEDFGISDLYVKSQLDQVLRIRSRTPLKDISSLEQLHIGKGFGSWVCELWGRVIHQKGLQIGPLLVGEDETHLSCNSGVDKMHIFERFVALILTESILGLVRRGRFFGRGEG